MKKKIVGILVCMLLIGTIGLAVADWDPGDGHKMHFPQLPDPLGWDVNFHDWFLADDWECSDSGPVWDIHFWVSFRRDEMVDLPYIKVDIFSNNPQSPGGWSQPLESLWTRTFTSDQFIMRGPFNGDQGWMEPYGEFFEHDHLMFYQINIVQIPDPFIQEEGTIYWLVVQMPFLYPIEIGWKTSLDSFMDAAVWGDPSGQWTPIMDPITLEPINFAFVITGGGISIPDLTCDGSLTWPRVYAGSTITGSFSVSNVGETGSLLDWEVYNWPAFGNWTIIPGSGSGLGAGSSVTVNVSVVAPPQKNKLFTGTVGVRNKNNYSDNCSILVSLENPRTKIVDSIFINLFQRFFSQFLVLRWILNQK